MKIFLVSISPIQKTLMFKSEWWILPGFWVWFFYSSLIFFSWNNFYEKLSRSRWANCSKTSNIFCQKNYKFVMSNTQIIERYRKTSYECSWSQKKPVRTLHFVIISLLSERICFKKNKSLSHLIAEQKFSKLPSLCRKPEPLFSSQPY